MWTRADPAELDAVVGRLALAIRAGSADKRVVNFARSLVAYAGDQSSRGIAQYLRNWLAAKWRFVHDPTQWDYNRPAVDSLTQYERDHVIVGDCDDAAIVAGALLRVLDFPVYLDVVSLAGDPAAWVHVYAWTLTAGGQAVEYDVTKPASGMVPSVADTATFQV